MCLLAHCYYCIYLYQNYVYCFFNVRNLIILSFIAFVYVVKRLSTENVRLQHV